MRWEIIIFITSLRILNKLLPSQLPYEKKKKNREGMYGLNRCAKGHNGHKVYRRAGGHNGPKVYRLAVGHNGHKFTESSNWGWLYIKFPESLTILSPST